MLSGDQRALLADLAGHIIAELKLRDHCHMLGRTDITFYHGGESSLEAACAVLQHIGLAHPVDASGELHADSTQWSRHFRLSSVRAAADILSRHEALKPIFIDQALSAFLDLKINYGLAPPLTATRSQFPVPPGYEVTFELLRACGYVEGADPRAQWTDQCAWAMRNRYLWTDDNRSRHEADAAACDEEARRVLAAMPDDVRQMLRQRAPNLLGLAEQIARRWRGGRWQAPTAKLSLAGQLEIARRVIELHRLG
jgi:hypothetical protein